MAKQIDIPVRLDARAFRRFCAFDTFRRQRRWYFPVMAAMVLITVSAAGLFGVVPLSESVSGVLMGLGLAIPMLIFGLYLIQIEAQVARQRLKEKPLVYTLRLSPEGVRVVNGQKQEAPIELGWDRFWGAFRRADCAYLYVNPQRAFILPDNQASAPPQEVWRYLQKYLGTEKCVERR
ncbi:MAG: YcxB family protein [Clostridia bacterium]|nr:YcxB family protein [Clostridia bacterium]